LNNGSIEHIRAGQGDENINVPALCTS
jgi:hypothetical protein